MSIKKLLIKTTLMSAILFATAMPLSVSAADVLNPVCENAPTGATLCEENQNEAHTDNRIYGPNGILTKVTRVILTLTGIAAVIVMIVGGFQYVLAGGEPGKVNSAKNTIIYAAVGLAVALIAQGIIIFVLNKVL